jgi:hypothetical protein
MRILLLLSALMAVALAIDASEFSGRHRRAVWSEANYQIQQFANKVNRSFEPRLD